MYNVFKQIILGDKSINTFDYTDPNIRISHLNFVAILFLNNACFDFQMGGISKEKIDSLLDEYASFIKNNQIINNYISSKYINPTELEENKYLQIINHEIVKFINEFKNPVVLEPDIKAKGFIEPTLLGLITFLSCILFLCILYLNI